MKRELDIGPMTISKLYDEKLGRDVRISYIVVENGPRLMDEDKEYTDVFNEMIEAAPSIKTASFYDSSYTNYKITIVGMNEKDILKIREIIEKTTQKEENQ